jgi:hypothetical protein
MKPSTFATLALAALLGAGCVDEADEAPPAWPEEAVSPAELAVTFSLQSDARGAVVAHVRGDDVVGADVNLSRFPGSPVSSSEGAPAPSASGVRGTAFGRAIFLDAGEAGCSGHVAGLVGGRPLSVGVTRAGDMVHVTGIVAGEPADFRLGELRGEGRLGRCAYELRRDGARYEGRRSCGGPSERVRLNVPAALDPWSDTERAALLAVLMGGG